jgi:hypothetical protein
VDCLLISAREEDPEAERAEAAADLQSDAAIAAGDECSAWSLQGAMFWFRRKKFVGSYVRLRARSRSYLVTP